MSKQLGLILLGGFLILGTAVNGQQVTDTLSTKELKKYKGQSRQLISFLEYSLNMLGNPETPASEKDIIINESFQKIFRDSAVQVEDDLDENRDMPISKDVQAYMKDIVFFFKDVSFAFEVKEVEHFVSENNRLTFKLTMNRHLKGVNIDDEQIDNNQERYVEINLNRQEKQLKIVSMYTHNINRKEELRQWWTQLPFRWRKVLGQKYALTDSLDMSDVTNFTDSVVRYYLDTLDVAPALVFRQLKKITELRQIDVSGNSGITTLTGLTKLSGLRKLDVSGTSVKSLLPIRNLNNLEYLKAVRTPLRSLDPLRYATQIKDLILNQSLLEDISAVANFPQLRRLHINNTQVDSLQPLKAAYNIQDLRLAGTPVKSIEPLAADTALVYLDISETNIADLSPLADLQKLERLDARKTPVADLSPLKGAKNLRVLLVDNTSISSLEPLLNLEHLNKIYCDNTGINEANAGVFTAKNPGAVVVYNTKALKNWWKQLGDAWKKVLREKLGFKGEPSKAGLHRISRIQNIDVSGNKAIRDLSPIARLSNMENLNIAKTPAKNLTPLKDLLNLRTFSCEGTRVDDLSPLSGLKNLETLNCSKTSVRDLSPVSGLEHLEVLDVSNTLVKDLSPLTGLSSLQHINANEAFAGKEQVRGLLEKQPECLVVFRTGALRTWWQGLPATWKEVFRRYVKMDQPPAPGQLHKLTTLSRLEISDKQNIKELEPLTVFFNLRELHLTNTSIRSLQPLGELQSLQKLNVADNHRIKSLKPLKPLKNLQALNFSNTAVGEIAPVKAMQQLEEIYLAGTKISGLQPLTPLAGLNKLRVIDFSNTNVRFLKNIKELKHLEKIKAYNSKVPKLFIKSFKKDHPDCEVVYY